MTSVGKIIGERVRQARIRAGLTQEKLAQKSQISTVTISRLERGATEYPRRAELTQIAAALGLDVDELMEVSLSSVDQPETTADDEGPSDDEINAAVGA